MRIYGKIVRFVRQKLPYRFGHWTIGIWDLFGIWCLQFVICPRVKLQGFFFDQTGRFSSQTTMNPEP
jgi:hypothetical protein